ncbi:MAG: 5'-methylthioadenosine/S-adenosylhomocysteine nucleosidase, partial [Myxococcota bacterium]
MRAVRSVAAALLPALLFLGGCEPRQVDPNQLPRIAIMCAFDAELQALLAQMQETSSATVIGRTFHIGKLGGKDVVLFASGISEVNAAMMAQAVVSGYNVTALVFSGVAGGLDPALNVSDVIVPEWWAQYQEQVYARAIPGGWDPWGPGYPINYPNYGMIFPLELCATSVSGPPDAEECRFWFRTDPALYHVAERSLNAIRLKRCKKNGECLENEPKVVIGGYAVTSPTFMDN